MGTAPWVAPKKAEKDNKNHKNIHENILFRMSINAYNPQQGASNVANIPSGEGVLDTRKHVVLSFKNMTYSCDILKNKCEGKVMLTNKRVRSNQRSNDQVERINVLQELARKIVRF